VIFIEYYIGHASCVYIPRSLTLSAINSSGNAKLLLLVAFYICNELDVHLHSLNEYLRVGSMFSNSLGGK
jgi:hypothetical protein